MEKLVKIKELKNLWDSEKEDYRTNEVGTGVQNFVKKVLESTELFNLNEGKLKTKREKRKGEFIYEKGTKERRKVDFVIYIDSEIVIPVEVECHTHIERGIEQLKKYQKDLEKKYGILTDGFSWQFWNNEIIEQEFKIDDILNEPSKFLTFWNEYIKPIHYYSTFFEGEVISLPVESHKESFFDDTTFLIKNIKNKLQIEGYFQNLDDKEKNKRATQLAYSYLIQFVLYKTLVDNEFDEFLEEYQKSLNLLSKCIKEDKYHSIFNIIENISKKISENVYKPFHKEQEIIEKKINEIRSKPELELSDISLWLDIFVYVKKYNFRNIRNDIFGFIYENYLKELFGEEKKGQYFTDPAIVNFMIEQIGYTPKDIKEKMGKGEMDKLSIIDPACGSGTFLYTAVNNILNSFSDGLEASKKIEELISNNVFGLDIEEFPLYLAEMSILMRLLPIIIGKKYNNPFDKKIKLFLTNDSIAEFINENINSEIDSAVNNGQVKLQYYQQPEYQSFMRDKNDLEEMKQSLSKHYKIPRRRFDYVIGNPPYISYNDCSKKGVGIFKLLKEHKVQLSNIYGVNLHSIPSKPKKYPPKPNLFAFFISLGLKLLKDEGKICYIIPQTMLIDPDYDVIRYYLSKKVILEKIITFSNKMFIQRGLNQKKEIPTSSLIFVAKKSPYSENNKVKIIHYPKCDDTLSDALKNILAMKNVEEKEIPQRILVDNLSNWNILKCNEEFIEFYEEYKRSENIEVYYDHNKALQSFKSKFFFDIGFTLNQKFISNQKDKDYYAFLDFNDFCSLTNYKPSKWYPSDKSKIELTKNSQGYVTLEQKYKIVWSIKNTDNFYLTESPLIFYMGKAGIICSNNREEILYLFALLNSKVNKTILQNMLKVEHEDVRKVLVSIRGIKDLIKVPKINKENQKIKNEVIKKTEELLNLEDKKLSDFVDFSDILMQRFDEVKVENCFLIMIKEKEIIKRKIKGSWNKIKEKVENRFLDKNEVDLSSLKNIPIIDLDNQSMIKDYIDDLVFALYFNLDLSGSLGNTDKVRKICMKNKFYKIIEKS